MHARELITQLERILQESGEPDLRLTVEHPGGVSVKLEVEYEGLDYINLNVF
jgi:hypothetical protein